MSSFYNPTIPAAKEIPKGLNQMAVNQSLPLTEENVTILMNTNENIVIVLRQLFFHCS